MKQNKVQLTFTSVTTTKSLERKHSVTPSLVLVCIYVLIQVNWYLLVAQTHMMTCLIEYQPEEGRLTHRCARNPDTLTHEADGELRAFHASSGVCLSSKGVRDKRVG